MTQTTATSADQAFDDMNDALRAIRGQLEWLGAQTVADPDGELTETAAMLRLKRGCRRG